jgi:hypothetical protein
MGKKGKNNNQRRDPFTNVKSMGKEGMKIMRDIAFGNYNIYAEGHVFRNLDFVKATITEIDKRLMDLNIHITGVQYAYGNSNDPNVTNLLYRDRRAFEAYSLMKEVMCSIYMSGGDTGFLMVLAGRLPAYKYNI